MAVKHTLVYHEPPGVLRAIVPTIHGDGYSQRPLGNGRAPWVSLLEDAVRGDVTAYDGHLEVESFLETDEIADDFARALEEVWGFPVRFVERGEFYDRHPLGIEMELSPSQ